MIRQMDTEFMFIKMVQDTKVNGKMIYNTDLEKKSGLIIANTKATTPKVKNMEKDFTYGKMDPCIMVIGLKIGLRGMESISGRMGECTSANGKTIICTVKVSTPGQTADDTTDNMKWTKNTASECTSGLTAEFTKEIGLMENNTDKENTYYKIKL